jgi:hypothetical protein
MTVVDKLLTLTGEALQRHNQQVDQQTKTLQKTLKSRGFQLADRLRRSAQFEQRWQRDQETIWITGWHGQGRYGAAKSLFTVTMNLVHLDLEDHKGPDAQAEFLTRVIKWAETL